MLGRIPIRIWVQAGVLLVLAACNRPDLVDPTATPVPQILSLEEIETAVVATLLAEGDLTAAARPSDTASPDEPSQTPTPASSSTPAPTSTPTPTSTPSPTDKPTLAPPTNTVAPAPTSTPRPTDKPTSLPPKNTPCPKITNATLSARPSGDDVILVWGSVGGCGPYSGTLSATYKGENSAYRKREISAPSGKLTDTPPSFKPCREGEFTVVYELTLRDSSGQTVTANAAVEVTLKC